MFVKLDVLQPQHKSPRVQCMPNGKTRLLNCEGEGGRGEKPKATPQLDILQRDGLMRLNDLVLNVSNNGR